MHLDISWKDERLAMPIASPIMNTKVWSGMMLGEVRKKKASVIWKSERIVIIVAADMSAIAAVLKKGESQREGSVNQRE